MTSLNAFRDRSDIELELQNAKLQNTNPIVYSVICPVQQNLKPDKTNNNVASEESDENFDEDIKIFQLTEQQTQMLLSNGECFTIKGSENEHCSIFSKDSSFTLRSGETSNTLLFVSDVKVPTSGAPRVPAETNVITTSVECSSQIYYEITDGRPRLAKALQLLKPSAVKMKSDNSLTEAKINSYTFHELSQAVHASDQELRAYLRDRNVMHVDDDCLELKLLDDSYFAHVAMMILRRLEEESYEVGKVPKDECIECLQTLEPLDVLQFVFGKLFGQSESASDLSEDAQTEKVSESRTGCDNNSNCYRLNDKSVCRLFAYYLLSQFDKMSSEQFEQIVRESLPEGVTWNYEHVNDCLITLEAPQKNREIVTYVKYFPEWELPDDLPEKRLTELWSAKGANSKWTLKELTPFLLPAVGNKQQAVTSLLTKFAKSSNDSATGQKVFTKRY